MKKRLRIIAVVMMILSGTAVLWGSGDSTNEDTMGGNRVDCYSSSIQKSKRTYYDCGPCTKIYGERGTGNMTSCIAKGGGLQS